MFYLYQVFLWFLLLLVISTKIKKKHRRIIFSIIASFVSTIEIVAVYMTNTFIDYRFYNHMNLNAIEGQGFQFVYQFIFFIGLFVLLTIIFYYLSKKMSHYMFSHNKIYIPVILTLFILLSLPNGIVNEAYKIYQILNAEEKLFNQALKSVGIPPEKYITPDRLTATKGKNIIVISIESLEQGFLGKNFNHITPHLTKLTKEWTYYNKMSVGPGGGWTAGSLYKHQVGMPAFFKGQGNDFFQGTTSVKLTGLGHVLNKAGYNSKYIVGNAEFAGMADILTAYGISIISADNSIGKYPKVANGFNDYDLFNETKLQINELRKNKNKPFALFLSTINTHFPNGIYDKRMEKFITKRENNLEFSVSSVDYLVNNLINYLKKNKLFDNTAIYIFPDHTLMGSTGPVHKKLTKSKRKLYLLTNVKESKFPKATTETLYQIDLPKMIIAGANIKTNATFLVDYIKTKDTIAFLNKNRVELTTLNSASVSKVNYKNGIKVQINNGNLRVASDMNFIDFLLPSSDITYDVTFNPEMVLIDKKQISQKQAYRLTVYDKPHKRLHLIISIKNKKMISTYFGDKYRIGLKKDGNSTVLFTKEEIKMITDSNKVKVKKEIKKVKIPKKIIHNDSTIVSITSSEHTTSKYIHSQIKVGDQSFNLGRGLNLLMIDYRGKAKVEHFDIYTNEQSARDFLTKIESLIKAKRFWAVAAHDVIKTTWTGFKDKLQFLHLNVLAHLNDRVAYIAYTNFEGKIKEVTSKTTVSYIFPSFIKPLTDEEKIEIEKRKIQNNIEANTYAKDKNRFIAHAGGQIDGKNYTDSLEALDLSYKKGYRLFELDIIKTSDNVYVAAHDWKHWTKVTNFKGNLPPNRETFKQYKIYGKYTSMDMDDINQWFKKHPDAILITDKVNTPMDFANHFIDKKRLMMELFTWDAVKQGIDAGIKSAMPTGSILRQIKGDKITYLKNLGITDIALTRRVIDSQKNFLKEIVNSGIHIYAFNINFDKNKDELYVICKERDYFYGMYADKRDFNSTINCDKY